MIHEIARITVHPGQGSAFEKAFAAAVPLFRRARGCRSLRLERSVETEGHYVLVIGWERLEDHIVHFRGSDDYGRWRALVAGFFAAPPEVDHSEVVASWTGSVEQRT